MNLELYILVFPLFFVDGCLSSVCIRMKVGPIALFGDFKTLWLVVVILGYVNNNTTKTDLNYLPCPCTRVLGSSILIIVYSNKEIRKRNRKYFLLYTLQYTDT